MISLDDPQWGELRDSFGSAADLPRLLGELALATQPSQGHDAEPWFSLWSRLCHQDDVYSASYAAVPHIVRIGSETKQSIDFSFLMLPACVEIARQAGRGPAIPAALVADYFEAIGLLTEIVSFHRHEPWDEPMLRSAIAALAVAKGHVDLAEAIVNLDANLIARINSGEVE